MQIPKRKSEELKPRHEADFYITPEKLEQFKNEFENLEKQRRPEAIRATQEAAAMGDFSENAAYQIAKANLRRINSRIDVLQEKIKKAVIIQPSKLEKVEIGSTVTIEKDGENFTYQILGSEESNPSQGKISYHSPLGSALLHHKVGDIVKIQGKEIEYKILDIN